jgi:peptidoglycan/LPS O-acetylase OafA/YrhL
MLPERPAASGGGKVWFAQALRPVGCLLVVANHYLFLFVAAPQTAALFGFFPPITDLPTPSYLGVGRFFDRIHIGPRMFAVCLLFLVSGFVIPYSLRVGSVWQFVVRRVLRVYPTLWVGLAVVFAGVWLQARASGLPNPFTNARSVVSNVLLVNPYVGERYIETVCWTLAVEELFYVVCAALAGRALLARPAAVLAAAAVPAALSVVWNVIPDDVRQRAAEVVATHLGADPGGGRVLWAFVHALAFHSTFLVYIFVGVVLHHVYVGAWRPRVGVPAAVALLALFGVCCRFGLATPAGSYPGYFYDALNALVVFVLAMLANRRLPYSRVVDWLADRSYPIYLLHATLGYITIRAVYLATGQLYLGMAVAFLGTLGLAAVVHAGVENPSVRLGRWLTRRPPPRSHADVPPAALPRAA